ncbi:MAG TPA: M14 family zinc carboxypeptidase [Gemmatimonadaceae bacterium]|nr:M14 family zinc carboxypeptidase [Gemmatimonadaceae bacterium]
MRRVLLSALLLTACSRGPAREAPAPSPAPTPASAATAATATRTACCLDQGLRIADRWRAPEITGRRFTHETLWRALAPATQAPRLRTREIGRSLQGREIRAITFGEGPVTVLLWSQMHGDESTATMALADVLRWMAADDADPLRERLRSALTITMVPMLNPDGAELFQRQNAVGIDVNRDARMLSTPEARALKALRDELQPRFGFNLHDQNARQLVGQGGLPAAIALLAPAASEDKSWPAGRARARLVAATIANMLAFEIPGRTAKYDDTFNARAFGDLMQAWGTSTVLVESGALPNDPQKQRLRAVNVAILLTALDAIATGGYAQADPRLYEQLPYNTSVRYDVVVVGGTVVLPGLAPVRADLAFTYDDAVARTGLRLRDVGDLRDVAALDTVDASGLFLHPTPETLTTRDEQRWLVLGESAELTVRRGVGPGSEEVRRWGKE